MQLEELKRLCEEAIADHKGLSWAPTISIIIRRRSYGERVRVAPGLMGKNLGYYPHYKEGTWDVEFWGSMVSLKVADVQKWIEKAEAELEGDRT